MKTAHYVPNGVRSCEQQPGQAPLTQAQLICIVAFFGVFLSTGFLDGVDDSNLFGQTSSSAEKPDKQLPLDPETGKPRPTSAASIIAYSNAVDPASGETVESIQEEAASPNTAEPKTPQFIRIKFRDQESRREPLSLQTAITRYQRREDGSESVSIDLIAAVHIGETEYYQVLNGLFEDYDVVLYELVADEGHVVDEENRGTNPLRLMQSIPQKLLQLDSQLAVVDYSAENFVHADMTPAELQAKLAERGESSLTVALDTISEMLKRQNLAESVAGNSSAAELPAGDSAPATGGFDELVTMMENPGQMRLAMAQQFIDSGDLAMGLGKSLNRLLIKDRNEAAMQDLSKQIFLGKKKIAIFYGAAHMPDFDKRLRSAYEVEPVSQAWVNAWDLTAQLDTKRDLGQMLLQMLEEIGNDQ